MSRSRAVPSGCATTAPGLVDFTIKNEGQAAADARLELGFRGKDHGSIRHDQKDGIIRITSGSRVLALVDLRVRRALKAGLGSDGRQALWEVAARKRSRGVLF